jgi:outer membrane protein assembly factor BamE (lipoprotein component of BamABCDE complex)
MLVWGACAALCAVSQSGCVSGASHSQDLGSANERAMTVGVVQKEIRKGQSQAEVVAALGSPNMVTKDRDDNETWVYDKIATEASYSNSSVGVGGAAGAGAFLSPTLLLGGVGANYSRSAGASSSTQRTLTVIIKFDKRGLVDSFSYHSSKF